MASPVASIESQVVAATADLPAAADEHEDCADGCQHCAQCTTCANVHGGLAALTATGAAAIPSVTKFGRPADHAATLLARVSGPYRPPRV